MADSPPVTQSPSRNVVIAMVIVLIVIAIAGIVLAGRRTASPAPGTAAALPATPPLVTPKYEEAPTAGPKANEVLFTAGSDRLSPESSESIAKFVDGARRIGGMVRVSAKFAAGADKAKDVELAKSRTAVVRHAVVANGMKPESMQVELVELPAGTLREREANLIELSLH